MPDPASLPLEIFGKILDEIIVHPKHPDRPTNYKWTNTAQQLHSSTLVSRRWHACSVSKFYSHWRYDGSKQGIVGLWNFYCTVRSNQALAMLVRSACIQQWDPVKLGDLETSSGNTNATLDSNITDDGVFKSDRLAITGSMSLRVKRLGPHLLVHVRPLMAVVMTYLPNLASLLVVTDRLDAYFASLLLNSTRAENGFQPRAVAFQHLKDGSFYTRKRGSPGGYEEEEQKYGPSLENMWPAYLLPRIESLTISGVKLEALPKNRLTVCSGTSSVKTFTLTLCTFSSMSYDMALTMLTLPTALTSLSLYFTTRNSFFSKAVTNAELWKILITYQHTLRNLNIYRDTLAYIFHHEGNEHMGLLSGFERLETLSIQPEALFGGCCGAEGAPFQLKDTLPPSLTSLTLYDFEEGDEMYNLIEKQLTKVVRDQRYASLKSITLEDESQRWWDPETGLILHALEEACEGKKVELRIYQGFTDPFERIACFPTLPGLERAFYFDGESDFSEYDFTGKVRQIIDLGYRSSE